MKRRGRRLLFAGKMQTTIGVRAPDPLVDAIFVLAQRRGTDVSAITRACWERLLRREGMLLSETSAPDQPKAS